MRRARSSSAAVGARCVHGTKKARRDARRATSAPAGAATRWATTAETGAHQPPVPDDAGDARWMTREAERLECLLHAVDGDERNGGDCPQCGGRQARERARVGTRARRECRPAQEHRRTDAEREDRPRNERVQVRVSLRDQLRVGTCAVRERVPRPVDDEPPPPARATDAGAARIIEGYVTVSFPQVSGPRFPDASVARTQ